MPPASLTRNYDAVLSACLDAFIGKNPVDQIFKDHVLLEVLKSKGVIQPQSGGYKLRVPLGYADNSTVDSYNGYDILDTTPQDEFTTAFYDWRQLAGAVTISGIEEEQNKSEAEIFDLLQGKTNVTLATMRERLNYMLLGRTVSSGVWSAGTGATSATTQTDVDPIPAALSRNPGQSVAIGEINKNTYSWWRPYAANLGNDTAEYSETIFKDCTTLALVIHYLNRLYYYCSRAAGGRPDVGICSQGAFEVIEAALRLQNRYTSTDDASVAFDNIAWKKGCPLYWDEMMPDIYTGVVHDSGSYAKESLYFLNTKFMHVKHSSEKNFTPEPFVKPENQDAKVSQILWYGNLCWSGLRKHGVAYNIDGTLTA